MERNQVKENAKRKFLAIENKHREIKKIATMSSKDPNYYSYDTSDAQCCLINDVYCEKKFGSWIFGNYGIWIYNLAWYIIKHELDCEEKEEKMIDYLFGQFTHNKSYIDNFPKDKVKDLYTTKEVIKAIDNLKNEEGQ